MWKAATAGIIALVVLATAACSDDDTTSTPDVNMAGAWVFTADGAQPPRTLACSNGHSALVNTFLCNSFTVVLQQTGTSFSGSSPQDYCGADITASGGINGDDVSGQVLEDDGNSIQGFTFTGAVTGDTATIEPHIFAVAGLSGDCTVSGFYHASR